MTAPSSAPSVCSRSRAAARRRRGRHLLRVARVVDARRLDADVDEARRAQLRLVLGVEQRAGDAPGPELHRLARRLRERLAEHDVGDGEATARLEHAERLAQHLILVRREVDDAVRDDDVDRVARAAGCSRWCPAGTRRSSRRPSPCSRWRASSISSVMSRPYALPVGPTRLAESSTSMPPPDPRSSTTSPGRSSASAVGLPQPNDASSASARGAPPVLVRSRRDRA